MKPLEALMDAIGLGMFNERTRRFQKPGDIIKRMSPEHREALAELTSDDAQKVRMDLVFEQSNKNKCLKNPKPKKKFNQ